MKRRTPYVTRGMARSGLRAVMGQRRPRTVSSGIAAIKTAATGRKRRRLW